MCNVPDTSLLITTARDGLQTQTSITAMPSHVDRAQLESDSYVLTKLAMKDGGAYASTYGCGIESDLYVGIIGWEVPTVSLLLAS